jgi:hypothetical protein
MRGWIVLSMAALAACGSQEASAPPTEDAPVMMKAGQWTLARTMTAYNTPTVTAEQYAAKVGTKSSADVCLSVDPKGLPDADALAGDEGKKCTYKEGFAHKGRLVASLVCKSGSGSSELSVEGNYTADTLTFGVSMTRSEGGKPVLSTTHDLTGKRTGDCKAAT